MGLDMGFGLLNWQSDEAEGIEKRRHAKGYHNYNCLALFGWLDTRGL